MKTTSQWTESNDTLVVVVVVVVAFEFDTLQ
jgi:hypothetical protein